MALNRYVATAGVPTALVMLVVWGVWTFAFTAPGWVHVLLTAGVFLLLWAIVVRGTPERPKADETARRSSRQ